MGGEIMKKLLSLVLALCLVGQGYAAAPTQAQLTEIIILLAQVESAQKAGNTEEAAELEKRAEVKMAPLGLTKGDVAKLSMEAAMEGMQEATSPATAAQQNLQYLQRQAILLQELSS